MANTRRELKPYKGFSIVKVNNYHYFVYNKKTSAHFDGYDLKEVKRKIDEDFKETKDIDYIKLNK